MQTFPDDYKWQLQRYRSYTEYDQTTLRGQQRCFTSLPLRLYNKLQTNFSSCRISGYSSASFFFFRLNEMDTAVTGLDWGVQAVQPFRPHSTVLFFYSSVSFGRWPLNGNIVHLSDDRRMNIETLTECNTGKHNFCHFKDKLCLLRVFPRWIQMYYQNFLITKQFYFVADF
jgi:hypothetical protein